MTQPRDRSNHVDVAPGVTGDESFQLGEGKVKPSLNRIEMGSMVHQVEPKVMQVLLTLCARPGHVVPREQLDCGK